MNGDGAGLSAALWWHTENGRVKCDLCPHECSLKPGQTGLCGVRRANASGDTLLSLNFRLAASLHLDPVEKKPLFHWRPGSKILSVGTVGCNLRCPFCQNWELARWDSSISLEAIDPCTLVETARQHKSDAVAFTYNEPLVWYEFLHEAGPLLKREGLGVVLVTNGTINPAPLREILPFISAANVDLKVFTEEGYRMLGGELGTVLQTIKAMKDAGIHVELTHLVVPGINIDTRAFEEMVDWISQVDENMPLHLSRYFPAWKWVEAATPLAAMETFREIASRKLAFVYMGNIPEKGVTRCRGCGRDIVVREGYNVVHIELAPDGKCRYCGQDNGIVMKH